jgi:hypothetical protein
MFDSPGPALQFLLEHNAVRKSDEQGEIRFDVLLAGFPHLKQTFGADPPGPPVEVSEFVSEAKRFLRANPLVRSQ